MLSRRARGEHQVDEAAENGVEIPVEAVDEKAVEQVVEAPDATRSSWHVHQPPGVDLDPLPDEHEPGGPRSHLLVSDFSPVIRGIQLFALSLVGSSGSFSTTFF